MRKLAFTLLVIAAAACSRSGARLPTAPRGEPLLEIRGAVRGGPFRLGREELAALPRRELRGLDPATGRESTWEGVALAPILTERVELTGGADTVLVRTADGRAIPIPLTLVRQLRPVLAERVDGAALAEPRVAWPDAEQRGLRTDPRAPLWWATGVVALELVNGHAALGRALAVPPGAPQGARIGADLFAARCIACHGLRKAGGTNGPDLTRAADRIDRAGLARILADHPGWSARGREPPGEAAAGNLWAFLRAVAADPGLAQEEPRPEREEDEGPRSPGEPR